MTRRALCLLLACVPRALSATRVASAEDAVARMYTFWCTEIHQAQAVCRRRALIDQYNAATSAKERKPILVSLHAISRSEASKTYIAMKKQFCSTADAKALPICTDHGGMWVDDAVFEWLCVKPDLSTDQRRMCERQDVARKLRGLTNTTARKELLKQIRLIPFSIAVHQAAFAEYCSLGHNMETPTCAMTRRDREQDELRQAYCDGSLTIAFDKEKTWCKRKELEGALRATPSTARDKRVKIGQELSAIESASKKAGRGSESEFTAARLAFCEQPGKSVYAICKAIGRFTDQDGDTTYSYDDPEGEEVPSASVSG